MPLLQNRVFVGFSASCKVVPFRSEPQQESLQPVLALFGYGSPRGWRRSGQVAGSPQVPAGYGAEGAPLLSSLEKDIGFGQIRSFNGTALGKALKGEREAL